MKIEINAILDEFSMRTLEGIQKEGNYVIRGFRAGGPKNEIKRQRFKTELSKEKDIIATIKKYATGLIAKGTLDNTWTFINEIDNQMIANKIESTKKENVILELISNNREDAINEICYFKDESVLKREVTKEADIELIKRLRNIITDQEKEVSNKETKIIDLQKEIERYKNELMVFKNKEKTLNEMLSLEKTKIKTIGNKFLELKEKKTLQDIELNNYKKNNKKLEMKNQKIVIMIIGGERIKEWFEQNNPLGKYMFIFEDLRMGQINTVENNDEIWLIDPYINMEYSKIIYANSYISDMDKLRRIYKFKDLEKVKQHMARQEVLM